MISVKDKVVTLSQEAYLRKQHPISFKDPGEAGEERSEGSRWGATVARHTATQTSPYVQAMVGRKVTKRNADVRLQYRCLGDPQDLTFIVYSDAAFASRQDFSSQAGYLLILVHRDVTTGSEGY